MEKMMVTPFIEKVDKALKKVDFNIEDDHKELFYKFLYEKHLKLYHYDETYPKYFKMLHFTILDHL